jgi:hypothetical protein
MYLGIHNQPDVSLAGFSCTDLWLFDSSIMSAYPCEQYKWDMSENVSKQFFSADDTRPRIKTKFLCLAKVSFFVLGSNALIEYLLPIYGAQSQFRP